MPRGVTPSRKPTAGDAITLRWQLRRVNYVRSHGRRRLTAIVRSSSATHDRTCPKTGGVRRFTSSETRSVALRFPRQFNFGSAPEPRQRRLEVVDVTVEITASVIDMIRRSRENYTVRRVFSSERAVRAGIRSPRRRQYGHRRSSSTWTRLVGHDLIRRRWSALTRVFTPSSDDRSTSNSQNAVRYSKVIGRSNTVGYRRRRSVRASALTGRSLRPSGRYCRRESPVDRRRRWCSNRRSGGLRSSEATSATER